MTLIRSLLFAILIYCSLNSLYSQNTADSLKNRNFPYLSNQIIANQFKEPQKATVYAHEYLNRAKKLKDSTRIINGYINLANLYEFDKAIKYIDSAITYNNRRELSNYSFLQNFKGLLLYGNSNYKAALDNYIQAKKYAEQVNNQSLIIDIDYNLSLLKSRIGDYEGALVSIKDGYNAFLKGKKRSHGSHEKFLNILNTLTISYLKTKEIDSASLFNRYEIDIAAQYKKSKEFYFQSRITEALINYEKKKYQSTVDSIEKYLPLINLENDLHNKAATLFYLGKTYKELNNWDKALLNLKKVDTIVEQNKIFLLELEENYTILKDYYKAENDLENQLLYLEKLQDFSSNLYDNNTYVNNTLVLKYDLPNLVKEKETIIKQLKKSDTNKSNLVILLSISTFFLMLLAFYYYRKRVIYKKSFEKLMTHKDNATIIENKKKDAKEIEKLKVPEAIVQEILTKIKIFEQEKGFLETTITLQNLAKSFGTNSNYLSRTINHFKNKNFSNYLSDLRISHAVEALKAQPKLRQYTIKAIAFEMGFKNSESFTNAFHKRTKIYPSYFIRRLKKQENFV